MAMTMAPPSGQKNKKGSRQQQQQLSQGERHAPERKEYSQRARQITTAESRGEAPQHAESNASQRNGTPCGSTPIKHGSLGVAQPQHLLFRKGKSSTCSIPAPSARGSEVEGSNPAVSSGGSCTTGIGDSGVATTCMPGGVAPSWNRQQSPSAGQPPAVGSTGPESILERRNSTCFVPSSQLAGCCLPSTSFPGSPLSYSASYSASYSVPPPFPLCSVAPDFPHVPPQEIVAPLVTVPSQSGSPTTQQPPHHHQLQNFSHSRYKNSVSGVTAAFLMSPSSCPSLSTPSTSVPPSSSTVASSYSGDSAQWDSRQGRLIEGSMGGSVGSSDNVSLSVDAAAGLLPTLGGPDVAPQHPPAATPQVPVKLFVNKLPDWYTVDDVTKLLSPFGPLADVNILKGANGPKGCAIVKFHSVTDAHRAILSLNGKRKLGEGGAPVVIKYADGEVERLGLPADSQPGGEAVKLFVGCLPKSAAEDDLVSLFSRFGRVDEVYLIRDGNQQSKCSAFITFPRTSMAQAAIRSLDRRYIMPNARRPLEVRLAENKRVNGRVTRGGTAQTPTTNSGNSTARAAGDKNCRSSTGQQPRVVQQKSQPQTSPRTQKQRRESQGQQMHLVTTGGSGVAQGKSNNVGQSLHSQKSRNSVEQQQGRGSGNQGYQKKKFKQVACERNTEFGTSHVNQQHAPAQILHSPHVPSLMQHCPSQVIGGQNPGLGIDAPDQLSRFPAQPPIGMIPAMYHQGPARGYIVPSQSSMSPPIDTSLLLSQRQTRRGVPVLQQSPPFNMYCSTDALTTASTTSTAPSNHAGSFQPLPSAALPCTSDSADVQNVANLAQSGGQERSGLPDGQAMYGPSSAFPSAGGASPCSMAHTAHIRTGAFPEAPRYPATAIALTNTGYAAPVSQCGDWLEYSAADGRSYYYNLVTRVSQWEQPPSYTKGGAATGSNPALAEGMALGATVGYTATSSMSFSLKGSASF